MLKYALLFCLITCQLSLIAQQDTSTLYEPRDIKKLTIIDLHAQDKSFPTSYLYGMSGDNLVLLTDVSSWKEDPIYARSKIRIQNYEYMMVTSRKERIKNSLIWGTIVGSLSFYLSRELTRTQPGDLSTTQMITGQNGNNGVMPGLIGGITGFGIGIAIGQHLSKRKIDLKSQKTQGLRYLREFNY